MSTIALDCGRIGFEMARRRRRPVFVLEVADDAAVRGRGVRCEPVERRRLHRARWTGCTSSPLEPELRIIEFPKPAGTGFFKSLHTKSADRGSKVAKSVMALVARPELSAEVQTELLRFLGVYDDGRLPDGMLGRRPTPAAASATRRGRRSRQLERFLAPRSSRVARQRADARRARRHDRPPRATCTRWRSVLRPRLAPPLFVLSAQRPLRATTRARLRRRRSASSTSSPRLLRRRLAQPPFGFAALRLYAAFRMAAEAAPRAPIPRRANSAAAITAGAASDAPPLPHAPPQAAREKMMFMFRLARAAQGGGDAAEGALSLGILDGDAWALWMLLDATPPARAATPSPLLPRPRREEPRCRRAATTAVARAGDSPPRQMARVDPPTTLGEAEDSGRAPWRARGTRSRVLRRRRPDDERADRGYLAALSLRPEAEP